ncbi:hypothetical protein D3C85_1365230 [compost metagenome]
MSKMGADSDVKCGSSAWRQRLMWCFCTSSRIACTSFIVYELPGAPPWLSGMAEAISCSSSSRVMAAGRWARKLRPSAEDSRGITVPTRNSSKGRLRLPSTR